MSETNDTTDIFTVPANEGNFNTVAMEGSMQQILSENLGNFVVVDFLIGTESREIKQGILYSVGNSYIVLYDDVTNVYNVCDIFAVKFVTFYLPGQRPAQTSGAAAVNRDATEPVNESAAEAMARSPALPTASQAAYSYIANKTRR